MAVPRRKISKTMRNTRRAHHALDPLNLSRCPNCNAYKLNHSVCESCGFYKGRFLPKNMLKADLAAPVRF